jgi:hypothetical protein
MRLLDNAVLRGAIPFLVALLSAAVTCILLFLLIIFSANHFIGEEIIAASPGGGGGIALMALLLGALIGCFIGLGVGSLIYARLARSRVTARRVPGIRLVCSWTRLTIGSSDHGARVFGEPGRESMVVINQLRLVSAQSRVALPHR